MGGMEIATTSNHKRRLGMGISEESKQARDAKFDIKRREFVT
jgi:hypothetical protein